MGSQSAFRKSGSIAILLTSFIIALSSRADDAAVKPAKPRSSGDLRSEVNARSTALASEGFNLTAGIKLAGRGGTLERFGILFPPSDEERDVKVWMSVQGGNARVVLRRSGGATELPLLNWIARDGDSSLKGNFPAGSYVLEVDSTSSDGGYALLGVKGSAVLVPTLKDSGIAEVAAKPQQGFSWPYYLYVPKKVHSNRILVAPNNSGFATEDVELLRAAAAAEALRYTKLANRLGAPMLVPVFPRPEIVDDAGGGNLYLHALSRAALVATRDTWRRVDQQLVAMIDDARRLLAQRGHEMSSDVLMYGFSASGSFVNRFAFLHPKRVLAVASGSPGGWPIAPIATHDGVKLTYPMGVADLQSLTGESLDMPALKKVSSYFFMGDKDANDAVPNRDSFSEADEKLIFSKFGTTPVSRWAAAERLYRDSGLDAQFVLYPGAVHQITPQMDADITAFFERVLRGKTR